MAQTGYTPILIYSSSTASQAPSSSNLTNSTLGSELAINITDGKLFYKDNGGSVQVIAWKVTPTSAGGTGLTSYTAGDTLYYATGTTLSKLAIGASKTIMTSSGTAPQWSVSLDTTQGGTGLTSYTAGDLTYYASGTTLTKLGIGANTTILTSSGTAPQWTSASSVTIGTATNIAGGAAGSVPYQTGAGSTSLLAIGTAYQVLGVNAGATAPSWQPSATSVLTTQGDLLYASAANTLARLAKNTTASRYLSNSGTSNNPAWAQVDLTNGVTGTLSIGNGGTGQTSWTANGILYASGTTTLATSTNWKYDGTDVTLTAGNIIQGTAAKGINFTANSAAAGMTSQLLNWYEEGTWTPTFIFSTLGDLSVTYSVQVGRYTRIGRQVTVIADVETSAFTYTTASGTFRVSGLPFTSANTTGLNTVGSVAMSGWTKTCNYIVAQILPNVSVISFATSTSGGALAVLTATDVPSGTQQAVRLNITYFV